MKHNRNTSIYGYDPAFWRSRKRAAWICAAALIASALAAVAVDRWPNELELVFFGVGLLALMALCIVLGEMWESRRYHPWVAERFYGPRK
jgi:hypothetical protein